MRRDSGNMRRDSWNMRRDSWNMRRDSWKMRRDSGSMRHDTGNERRGREYYLEIKEMYYMTSDTLELSLKHTRAGNLLCYDSIE
jgi:hypothetical protein